MIGNPMQPIIQYRDVSKVFYKDNTPVHALDHVSTDVPAGELLAIVGPSGCGKSTLLNLTAGLTRPGMGEVLYAGQRLCGVNTSVSYVTQKDNLLPWRTAAANVALPLTLGSRARLSRRVRAERLEKYLALVGLEGFENHYPAELSGGMRKRVQLARSLVYEPDVLLMDEPFGALDAQLRLILQSELLRTWEGLGKTLIFVTHDLTEAISLADRVIVMSARPGRISAVERIDLPRPRDVFHVRFDPQFGDYFDRLWSALKAEMLDGQEV
jgi:NitT/TauT family transport system ATP-binding protein